MMKRNIALILANERVFPCKAITAGVSKVWKNSAAIFQVLEGLLDVHLLIVKIVQSIEIVKAEKRNDSERICRERVIRLNLIFPLQPVRNPLNLWTKPASDPRNWIIFIRPLR